MSCLCFNTAHSNIIYITEIVINPLSIIIQQIQNIIIIGIFLISYPNVKLHLYQPDYLSYMMYH